MLTRDRDSVAEDPSTAGERRHRELFGGSVEADRRGRNFTGPVPTTVPEVIARLRTIEAAAARADGVACFARLYREVTDGVDAELAHATCWSRLTRCSGGSAACCADENRAPAPSER